MRAVGVVLEAKIFVDLEQALLMRDCLHEFRPAGIAAEESGSACLKPAI